MPTRKKKKKTLSTDGRNIHYTAIMEKIKLQYGDVATSLTELIYKGNEISQQDIYIPTSLLQYDS